MAEIWTIWDAELGYSTTSLLQAGGEQPGPGAGHDGAEPMWGISRVRPDGVAHVHIIPHSTFEWRCAEYGIDPDDMDTLLDVVLHEPWIPSSDDALARLNPVVAAQLEATHGLPTTWTLGVSDADRLAAHLARIEAVKTHRVRMVPENRQFRQDVVAYVGLDVVVPEDPLEPVKTLTRLDSARVAARRRSVDYYRAGRAGPVTPDFDIKPPATWMGRKPWGPTDG
ncbi:hypothetical protein [Nonomuraea basaltis]|uniref:hypothetical protein n=1 Tax=Nonomuraea basaltis TaxID=2495887 RepID=UPI00110C558B|nr:hypothetical protein [Nonomuraea basaltis]TMR97523.1 hypothetical protein EJK15_17535 [Nonomuraea basaltis]